MKLALATTNFIKEPGTRGGGQSTNEHFCFYELHIRLYCPWIFRIFAVRLERIKDNLVCIDFIDRRLNKIGLLIAHNKITADIQFLVVYRKILYNTFNYLESTTKL